ncbi:MAG: sigma-54-dependent Fis family transcriptional regulator [Syntrophus sp. (in: bacteria)]|nr:sigma-54-dependent Fis family transcriptional regulator [Syntrophus sp. (in: bacteria)]
MINFCIYVIDDEPTIREGITMALEADYRVETFSEAEAALEAMVKSPPDLVLLDISLPGICGIEALGRIKRQCPDLLVIMVTAYEDSKSIISTMKAGAYDYLVKPIHMESLEVIVRNAIEATRLKKEVRALQESYLKENVPCFIGESNAILDVMGFVEQVAKSPDTPILILGETGVGKELIAGAIHYRSPNFSGPLIPVNCASIAKDLIESELFGYEKGAFSGALLSGKKGLIEESANGTLFFDEVGDLSLEAQAKLLRFLESGEFYRLGGTKKLNIQTRIVSATNKNLEAMVEKGQFRKDLYFRIAVIKVKVPSLKERQDDIIPLAKYFLMQFNAKFAKNVAGLSPEAHQFLIDHKWEGNVRELKNLLEKAVLTCRGNEITTEDLGVNLDVNYIEHYGHYEQKGNHYLFPPIGDSGIDFESLERSFETFYYKEALRLSKGNESKAAQLLNLNHHTFRYRKRKLGIE